MGTFYFDPRLMVSSPFITCPKCYQETFGILSIQDNSYDRRCKNCLYPSGNEPSAYYGLPRLNKKVIYVDQFVISNMMKVLNPETDAYRKGRTDEYWLRLFERLDSLCKLQLIICPDSEFHNNESLVTGFYNPLKRMYELLSCGRTFYDKQTIKRFQLHEHFSNWLSGRDNAPLNIKVKSVVHGNINSWTDRFIISIDMGMNVDLVDEIQTHREQSYIGLEGVFQGWYESRITDFNYWYRNEIQSYGKAIINEYLKHMKKFMGVTQIESYEELLPSSSSILINMMQRILREHSIDSNEAVWSKISDYFNNANFENLPFLHLSASLFASIARKAGAGRKKPPNRGTMNDIEMISTLLPYCDAMFIDNECASYIKEKPFADNIGYPTKIFSQSNREEFIQYLNRIEKNTTQEHFAKVNEVYGESWKSPYVTLYKKGLNP